MKFGILIFSLIASGFSYAAETAVVQQMKGKRAIIQFEKDIPFSVGQKVFLNSEDGTELGVTKEMRNPLERKNSVSLAMEVASTDTNPATTSYSLSGRYGWNQQRYEFGPMGTLSYQKKGSVASSEINRYSFGGFFDFNMIPNKPGEDFIWGAYGEAEIGNSKIATSSKSLTLLTGGAFVKWFIFSPMLAVRLNGFYSNEKQANTDATNTTGVQFAISHYF